MFLINLQQNVSLQSCNNNKKKDANTVTTLCLACIMLVENAQTGTSTASHPSSQPVNQMKKLEHSESTLKKITVDLMEDILIGKIHLFLAPAALSSQA